MDAPKCRLCGKRHWGVCAAIKADPAIMANKQPVVANEPDIVANSMANTESDMANTYKYRDAEKRRIYMKEYMRKKRGE